MTDEIISRKEAFEKGLKYYFTGKPCTRGHISKRLVSVHNCPDCSSERLEIYRKNNPEKIKENLRKYRENNRDYFTSYWENNKDYWKSETVRERNKSYQKRYSKENKGKRNFWTAQRRAVIKQRFVRWANKKAVRKIYESCPAGYHVDHIIPLHHKLVSGLHNEFNLQYLTAKENSIKLNKFEPYFSVE